MTGRLAHASCINGSHELVNTLIEHLFKSIMVQSEITPAYCSTENTIDSRVNDIVGVLFIDFLSYYSICFETFIDALVAFHR